ncbi:YkvA family protein [Caulobacter sp.]|uniref:YkvA family protein n=1 Tax=Caulobacter sp. TaxID=78 RepID=UPI003BAF047A
MSADTKPSPDVNPEANAREVLDPAKALVPATVKVNEQRVARGFWPKIRKVASRVPFAADALSLWWCARDPTTPVAAKGMMLAALAYFVLPTDAIPDVLPAIGFTDDAAVIAALIAIVGKNLKARHKDQAKTFLAKLGADD